MLKVLSLKINLNGVENMTKLEDILNSIGDFETKIADDTISSSGVLYKEENDVMLKCKFALRWYRSINPYTSSMQIYGKVNGIEVTLLGVVLKNGTHYGNEEYMSVTLDPSEIVIGKCYTAEPQIAQITISNPEFNGMLSSSPLQPNSSFSKESTALIEYTYSPPIKVVDRYGCLTINQTFGETWGRDVISYNIITAASYNFETSVGLSEAISRIAAAKNLFTFFANHYLTFGTISFLGAEEKESLTLSPYILYLNHEEIISFPQGPFLITSSKFEDNFQTIWVKWLAMYIEAEPVVALFYEIICNRSTRINRFLNLTQAIEVYSYRYREDDTKKVAQVREGTKKGKKPPVHLNHRLEDAFSIVSASLGIDESRIPDLSKSIADMRNYFTHYNAEKYIEPSYQEMIAGCHVLELVLLAIIYRHIGIPEKVIKACKRMVEFQRFDEFINLLNKEFLKSANGSK